MVQIPLERDDSGSGRAGPVYQQIAAWFRAEIEAGRLGPGDRLPTIRALARTLGVNRDTVALAYDALARDGRLESTVGRGSFVRRPEHAPAAVPFEPVLSPLVDRLLDFERARVRYAAPAGAVPLHSLVPDPALYPADEFRKTLARVLTREGGELLRYGPPQGHPGLRAVLAARLRETGLQISADEVVVTQGASEGIALALRLFAAPGDVVAVEEPTYHNVLSVLAAQGLRAVPVPVRDGAPDLAVLERVLERPEVKLFYTMPTFHNPLGTSTGLAHRRALLATAGRAGKPVVEDAFEMDLRYAGKPVPSLAALDERGLVVQLASFSKSLFPGARVGSIAARGRIVEALLALEQASHLGGAGVLQAALAEFVANGGYERHLARVRRTLRGRRDALLEALAREMPDGVRWTEPEGGLQLWVELPGFVDSAELLPDAVRAGVLFAPGFQFRSDPRPSSGLRLSIALAGEEEIRRGVAALGRVVRERLRAGATHLVGDDARV
ncbi:MAG: PLP-dependent aminotransferase family protein [Deltaproteobacteria bacterium]|nr:PLP-dependent aminotransferase family protein [Deltaproteobacteria bacterium]